MIVRCPHCASPVQLPTPTGLTPVQSKLLLFIHGHVTSKGYAPSFEDMKDAMGLRSKSGIHRLISGLEERGAIIRRHYRSRAIELTPAARAMFSQVAA